MYRQGSSGQGEGRAGDKKNAGEGRGVDLKFCPWNLKDSWLRLAVLMFTHAKPK